MAITYVAVGFRVDMPNSIFYFKESLLQKFMDKLEKAIMLKEPDFVSLRMVKANKEVSE